MAETATNPSDISETQAAIAAALEGVEKRFDHQLRSDLPPVSRLVSHVEHYRGKMLRPTLALVCGLAAPSAASGRHTAPSLSPDHITVAAVCEMIHMATLVHDDVLDEADTRRRGATVNRLAGNEAAVILGDYLIASAYHLCSQLDSQKVALLVGHVSMTLCAGELLQLSHRNDLSLDEPTYFEIVERKTASLIGLACRLGAQCSGADDATCARFERFGAKLGVAFQIQDDLLDLTGQQSTLGKPAGKDMEKGKLPLPMIHHLAAIRPGDRARSLFLLERACGIKADGKTASPVPHTETPGDAAAELRHALESSGSVAHSVRVAERLVSEAKLELAGIAQSGAKAILMMMAEAVVKRAF